MIGCLEENSPSSKLAIARSKIARNSRVKSLFLENAHFIIVKEFNMIEFTSFDKGLGIEPESLSNWFKTALKYL